MGLFDKKKPKSTKKADHRLVIGLGDAVRRLMYLENRYRSGQITETQGRERDLILDGLNAVPVPLQASCIPGEDLNSNGIPDTVEFFQLISEGNCGGCEMKKPDDVRVGSK